MEININTNMINAYKNVSKTRNVKEGAGSVRTRENVDKVEFDFSRSLNAAKANMASSIDAEANTSRLEELQAKYAGESCPVPAEEVAKSILGE